MKRILMMACLLLSTSAHAALTERDQNMVREFAYVQGMMVGFVGFLYVLPESVTHWESDERSTSERWSANVSSGPVIDTDDWAINYIGHPLSGSAYHIWARDNGYTPLESFGISTFMSTVVWEYGYEAVAEVPSIQDIILTPVVGSVIGEVLYDTYRDLEDGNGEIGGSHALGSLVKACINPIGELIELIDESWLGKLEVRPTTIMVPMDDRVQLNFGVTIGF